MVKVGILGAAGYTGGELIRVLLGHPDAEIVFANSESNAGNHVSEVHEGLIGETDLCFTSEMPFDKVDVAEDDARLQGRQHGELYASGKATGVCYTASPVNEFTVCLGQSIDKRRVKSEE